ncbi:LysM peptidoglycan-binding domain-containing protein [Olsenella sp. AF16-14LB]|jgi:hypothetical protein|uniref:cell division suppressor protein YneA n=1 Tax=Atopobiaceae TaxID=1643824 RepID=UPI0009E01C93|nr:MULTISPECIES: LysM peptidoglycan-binding domain-containing protein [unclassified Olsenella]RGJ47341.1 LysM peptidoglycan-binding domain-containing protein [Olsenella sp. TM06-36]RGS53026.1 LysM peptidoglycan-binding domain-containing protein [Olsenella sp. AF21-51]RGU51636.1 LysM peptidoglycan-binding domain-containing protein [Olsenella sp. AF16-14LB]RGU82865.1 LysM peptidoglycan-binding domain-containing protein [Olsenella sp. AF15-43LB]RHB56866.1 LysM peptidoglycan-binding domain-contain
MTNANRMYGTEGSSALVPSYPSLMLLEGGAGKKTSGVARRAQGQTPYPQAASRLDVFTVVVCTLLVAMGLFGALVAGNAAIASRKDAALSSIPTQDVVVEPGDSVWDLASQYQVDGYSTAELVQWITEKNSLTTSTLQPGQSLLVPASR